MTAGVGCGEPRMSRSWPVRRRETTRWRATVSHVGGKRTRRTRSGRAAYPSNAQPAAVFPGEEAGLPRRGQFESYTPATTSPMTGSVDPSTS